ncbi:hypothetical protein [Salinarchaeum laminariae]|uniref:hypothetical protein n=1 Tax=Salinarchaeum laminariae TaxID=869888 RepID=UPI0020C07C0D|nr:hypothetical protein [Salinarchaeum laminariae]
MSESDSDADGSTTEETGGASQEAPNHNAQQQQQTGGGTSLDDFVSQEEQAVIQDWLIYVGGLFAVLGLAIGLNSNIQDQWDHNLFDVSQGATGTPAVSYLVVTMVGIIALAFFGAIVARNVDNTENTAFKVAAVVSLVAMPILYLVAGFTVVIPYDNVSLNFVNVIVSGLGSGVAAAISSAIVVWLTENKAPTAISG